MTQTEFAIETSRKMIRSLFVLIFLCLPAFAQDQNVTHFSKNGLVFDYPVGMKFEDRSNEVGQHLVLLQGGAGAQVMVMSRYDKIGSAEQLAKARHDVADAFVEKIGQELQKMDPKNTRTPAQIEIGGTQATGVRLRATLNDEPGNAEIYSLLLGRRLVLVTFIGSDKELAAAASAWATIRGSLKIEDVDQATNPPG